MKCIKCEKEYKQYMFENFNLGLCEKCLKKCEDEERIIIDETVDEVTHKIVCPLCKKEYDSRIINKKCETKNCPVHFFIGDLDKNVFARWIIRGEIKCN